jgi:hypothetical protein
VLLRFALRADDVFFDFTNFVEYIVRRAATRAFIIVYRHSRIPSLKLVDESQTYTLCNATMCKKGQKDATPSVIAGEYAVMANEAKPTGLPCTPVIVSETQCEARSLRPCATGAAAVAGGTIWIR